MPETKSEPKFVNLSSQVVRVRFPDGSQRNVRPYRELVAFHWRKEEDCVCIGEHYAQFKGLLSPFPGADEAANLAVAPVSGLQAKAGSGRFTGTADVIRPDGSIKTDAPPAAAVVAPPVPPAPAPNDAQSTDTAGTDEPDDKPLEEVPGLSEKVIAALHAAGFTSARSLAECQDDESVAKLMAVKHVGRNAERFITAAQNLLGYVDEESSTESES